MTGIKKHTRACATICWALLAASLMLMPMTAAASPAGPAGVSVQPPPKGTPPALAKAWTQLKCRFGELEVITEPINGQPKHTNLDCFPKGYGFDIELYKNKKLGRAWWLDYALVECDYIAVKGNLVITSQDGPGDPYEYDATSYAAKKVGGRVLQAPGEDCPT